MQMRDRAKNKAKARRCPPSVLTANRPREFRFLSALVPWQGHVGTALMTSSKSRCLGDRRCRRWPGAVRRACTNACIAQAGDSQAARWAQRVDRADAAHRQQRWRIVACARRTTGRSCSVCRHARIQAICTHCPIDACHRTMVWRRHPACGAGNGLQAGRDQPPRPAARSRCTPIPGELPWRRPRQMPASGRRIEHVADPLKRDQHRGDEWRHAAACRTGGWGQRQFRQPMG